MDPTDTADLLQGQSPAEFAERFFAVSPLSAVILALVGVGAFGGYWLYRKGRMDERENVRIILDAIEKLRPPN